MRVLDPQFVPHTYFIKNVTINDPKSDATVLFKYLKDTCTKDGLNMAKVVGFGSDGASVIVGKHSSVSTRVKKESPHCINIHCIAHRLNLATSQASRNIPFMKEVELQTA